MMDNASCQLQQVISTPELVVENLHLGDPFWTPNSLSVEITNRSDSTLYLTIDIRCVVPDQVGGWQRQFYHELAPGERRSVSEEYHLKRILSPWYALFRGPCAVKARVTFARFSAEQFHPDAQGRRTYFGDVPDSILFQKWFEVLISADPPDKGVPVKPILPEAGDVTLERALPGGDSTGEHEMTVTLRNHTGEGRSVYVHVDTPGWGNGAEHLLPAHQSTELAVPYEINEPSHRGDGPRRILLQVIQLPLNFDELDIGEQRFFCRWLYRDAVPQAVVAEKSFPVRSEQ